MGRQGTEGTNRTLSCLHEVQLRQFYVSPCHESRLEVEQATEENRPGAVNSNVIHSLSHDSRVWLFCPNIWFYAVQASAAHPNFHCDQNSEQLLTDRTNRPAGHDLSWKCRAAPETSLCHRHRHNQYICMDIVRGMVLTGVGGGAGGRGHAAWSALDGRHLGEVVGSKSWVAVQGRVDGGWQEGVR